MNDIKFYVLMLVWEIGVLLFTLASFINLINSNYDNFTIAMVGNLVFMILGAIVLYLYKNGLGDINGMS